MLLLVNADDWLGKLIMHEKREEDFIHIKTPEVLHSLAFASDNHGEYIVYMKQKVYFDDIDSVYVGCQVNFSENNANNVLEDDLHYIQSSWNSALSYLFLNIPIKIGVMDHTAWTGSIWQLPNLYPLLKRYEIICPEYSFNTNPKHLKVLGKDCYSVNKLYVNYIDDFYCLPQIMNIANIGQFWVYTMILDQDIYSLQYRDNSWNKCDINTDLKVKLLKFSQDVKINCCQLIMRFDEPTNNYFCYAITRHISIHFQEHHKIPLQQSLQKLI